VMFDMKMKNVTFEKCKVFEDKKADPAAWS
jgi:hypothetical protein